MESLKYKTDIGNKTPIDKNQNIIAVSFVYMRSLMTTKSYYNEDWGAGDVTVSLCLNVM